jgi:hypothetical protein
MIERTKTLYCLDLDYSGRANAFEFDKFANGLSTNTTLRHLYIQGEFINPDMGLALSEGLGPASASQLTTLILENETLSDRSTASMLRAISCNKTLKRLKIPVGNESMVELHDFLHVNQSVRKLLLKINIIDGRSLDVEERALVDANPCPHASNDVLFKALRKNQTLKVLIESGFGVHRRHCPDLAQMLRENKTLEMVFLDDVHDSDEENPEWMELEDEEYEEQCQLAHEKSIREVAEVFETNQNTTLKILDWPGYHVNRVPPIENKDLWRDKCWKYWDSDSDLELD